MKTAINPTREVNFSEWYQQVIKSADLAENSVVRGCMVVKPNGFAIWERMKSILDLEFKKTGHKNCYFPLLIPLSFLEKEAEHVDGFAKECAVVTHRRLIEGENGGLRPDGELTEPYVIRPTSEMVIGESFSRWIKSYRDLPLKINQWANVMRWEMRPRIFLRTSEFLWQEGHTAHESKDEAIEETLLMLDVYRNFFEDSLAMPLVVGQKTDSEKFPGADTTYTVEAIMQDGKALQAGTSHFLGQNFSKAQNIKFLSSDKVEKYAWTTSWGVSTRMVGGLIMGHSDDNGLILPPKIAPIHVRIIPIYKNEDTKTSVMNYVEQFKNSLELEIFNNSKVTVDVDDRDLRGGEKYWSSIKEGVPITVEIGPRDVKENKVFVTNRFLGPGTKNSIDKDMFIKSLPKTLEEIQNSLKSRVQNRLEDCIVEVDDRDSFNKIFKKKSFPMKLALAYVLDNKENREILSGKSLSFRCIPLSEKDNPKGICIFSGKPVSKRVLIGQSY
ncbi:MAG: proline--tRNA ligase [Halobacteriovoraceae bacterium]|nr:proline--tRNA ligase [Halobacteriovoraceae bacterium]